MNRRQVLTRFAAAGSASLAGCSSVLGPDGTVLGKIKVINASFVPHRIRLTVTREGDLLMDRTIGLTALDADNRAMGTMIEPVWSRTQAQYTVSAFHLTEDGERESIDQEYTFTHSDYAAYYGESHKDPGCIGAVVTIGNFDTAETGTIGIGPTHMENPCTDGETESW